MGLYLVVQIIGGLTMIDSDHLFITVQFSTLTIRMLFQVFGNILKIDFNFAFRKAPERVLFIIRYYIGDIINNSLVLIAMVSIALKLAGKFKRI